MDINQAPPEPRDGLGRNPLQVSREHDEPGVTRGRHDLPRIIRVREHDGGHTCPLRSLERGRVGAARDHARNPRDRRVAQRVEQRLEVRAATRDQHGHRNRRHRSQGASDPGLGPATTLSVNAPVASRSLLVTTMK